MTENTHDAAIVRAVLAADQARYDAMLAKDYDRLAPLLGEQLVYTHSDGRSDDKQGYLARLRAGKVVYLVARASEVVLQVHGDSVVVMHGNSTLVVNRGAADVPLENRFLSVWARTGAQWQLVAWASTRMPER